MLRKLMSTVLAGVMICSCISAAGAVDETAIALSNGMNAESEIVRLEETEVDPGISDMGTRATQSLSWSVSAGKAKRTSTTISLEAGEYVTFNCSYSPSSDLVDFGLIASDNTFYYVTGTSGSINKTLEIETRGEYYVAIRNRSSSAVEVVGFVRY